jgi:hypothetical protein
MLKPESGLGLSSYLAAVTLTIMLTVLFAFIIVSFDLQAILSQWNERRCELPIMVMASWFKPENDPRTGSEFAQENFEFCTSKIVNEVLRIAFLPLLGVVKQQISAQGSFAAPMNNIRTMLQTGKTTFSNVIAEQYRRFNIVNTHFTKTWQHLTFAMGRVNAIMTGIVYFAISLLTSILNLIDFTFMVLLIVIGIMVVLVILLFFVLAPFIPVILAVITIMVGAGVAGAGGMAGAFCIDPEAKVVMNDGTVKPLSEVKCGDILGPDNIVTGVLKANSLDTPLVEIDGILMSDSHRVFHKDKWVLAGDHPEAVKSATVLPRVICLNTTKHYVKLFGKHGYVTAGDWEEVSTEEGQKSWIDFVYKTLNGASSPSYYPTLPPLVGSAVCVYHSVIGWVPIEHVGIGDQILGSKGYTSIVGTYKGEIPTQTNTSLWISDGVWIKNDKWATYSLGVRKQDIANREEGFFLITESEDFVIRMHKTTMLVRDFTELGASNMKDSYEMLDGYMNT